MKNAIYYYYSLNSSDIHQVSHRYFFQVKQENYVLMPYERDVKESKDLYELSLLLLQHQIPCHEFIWNRNQELVTIINNIPYVLLKIHIKNNDIITLNDLIIFSNATSNLIKENSLKRDDWRSLWIGKIDYFEYQVSQMGKKHPLIRESFSYYVGLAETSIELLGTVQNKKGSILCVSHKRIHKEDTLFDLYNPLTFIIDHRVRDASEYFKERFFEVEEIIEEVKYYITYNKLSIYECQLFFARMLFPTSYFDRYEDVIMEEKEDETLLPIIHQANSYEYFLRQLYFYFRQLAVLPDIEWLLKT